MTTNPYRCALCARIIYDIPTHVVDVAVPTATILPLTEKRIDVIIASEFAPDDPFQLRGSSKEGVAQHGAERLKRELVRLGFVSPDDTAERKEG